VPARARRAERRVVLAIAERAVQRGVRLVAIRPRPERDALIGEEGAHVVRYGRAEGESGHVIPLFPKRRSAPVKLHTIIVRTANENRQ
jgi:hypothetical protein